MMKRNHPLYIIKNIIKIIKSSFLPLIVLFAVNFKNMPTIAIVLIALALLGTLTLISFISWKGLSYEVKDNTLIVEKGIFGKSRQVIALDKITTINENQELLERFFNLSTFKVDVGSATKGNEIKLTISHTEAQLLKEELRGNSKTNTLVDDMPTQKKDGNSMQMGNKDLFIYALINSNLFLGIIFVAALVQFVNDIPIVDKWANKYYSGWIGKFSELDGVQTSIGTYILFVGILIAIYLLFTITASIIVTFVKYYQFTLVQSHNSLTIEYGLLDKKSFTLDTNKISAVYINYGILGQFMGISSLRVENIGYGDEKGEVALLYPMLNEKQRNELLLSLLPEFYVDGTNRLFPDKRAIVSYILRAAVIPFIIAVALTVIYQYGYLALPVILVFVGLGILSFRRAGIQFDKHSVLFTQGVLAKKYVVLKKKHIQSITLAQNPLQRRSGLVNLKYTCQGNTLGRTVRIKGMKKTTIETSGIGVLGLKD